MVGGGFVSVVGGRVVSFLIVVSIVVDSVVAMVVVAVVLMVAGAAVKESMLADFLLIGITLNFRILALED